MEATSQPTAAPAPVSSPTPTSVDQSWASPQGMNVPQTYQASMAPQTTIPLAPTYPTAVAPQASVPQAAAPSANPWQEAFQALSASLNTSSPSQAQVPYSAYQTPTP